MHPRKLILIDNNIQHKPAMYLGRKESSELDFTDQTVDISDPDWAKAVNNNTVKLYIVNY